MNGLAFVSKVAVPALGVFLGSVALSWALGGTVVDRGVVEKDGQKWRWYLHRNGLSWSPTIIFPSGSELEIGPFKKQSVAREEVIALADDFSESGQMVGGSTVGSARAATLQANRTNLRSGINTNLI